MNTLAVASRKFLKRHAEALFIVAFILADCFLSGWALTAGTIAAILYVAAPAIRAMSELTPAGRITYLKAFVKTPKVQRLGLLLFSIFAVRGLLYAVVAANLFSLDSTVPTGSTISSLLVGAQQFAPCAYFATPLIIYIGACFTAIVLRARLKATKQDPDLIAQRQRWSGATHILFASSFIAGILSITCNPHGPSYMLSNWLLASAKDANLFPAVPPDNSAGWTDFPSADMPMLPPVNSGMTEVLSFLQPFDTFIVSAVSIVLMLVLAQPAIRLHAFLASFCWRVVSPKSLQNVIEGFLEALRLPQRSLNFSEAHPFFKNGARTLLWLVAVYGALFWIFGFCGGPLGLAIHNWMLVSVVDAGFGTPTPAPDWIFDPKLRIFLGSIVALYGTAPVAVTAAVCLPFAKGRQMVVNCDGISFAQGPFVSLWGRQFRLWSDLASMKVKKIERANAPLKAKFTLTFRSGGRVSFGTSQISSKDLRVLLDAVDQYAAACEVDPEVFAVCQTLLDADRDAMSSDGIDDTAVASISSQEFKSTIFVPLGTGDFLPNTKTRIIKQLASKPLCAVYLARDEHGRMVTVKQFYLADETDETKAMAKILTREYELLRGLDHPGIAKVLDSFTVEKSTYLVIEHRLGSDMRAIVKEHGPRSESLTIAWAKQLCEIMMHLHGREPAIMHRDLTPDNVIVGEDGQLRLIDFGAAREFIEGITGTMIGKHGYVAPEQLRGDATQRSDVYSFGCTLFFLLTGRDPIALSQSSPAKNTDCSDELDRLIKDCTEFDEAQRPQSFDEILQRLSELDQGFSLKLPAAKVKVKV